VENPGTPGIDCDPLKLPELDRPDAQHSGSPIHFFLIPAGVQELLSALDILPTENAPFWHGSRYPVGRLHANGGRIVGIDHGSSNRVEGGAGRTPAGRPSSGPAKHCPGAALGNLSLPELRRFWDVSARLLHLKSQLKLQPFAQVVCCSIAKEISCSRCHFFFERRPDCS